MPWAPPMMAVLMPTTLPEASARGPPELPGLMAASVWMTFSIGPAALWPRMERPSALTTPAVTAALETQRAPDGDDELADHEVLRLARARPRSAPPPASKRTTPRSLGGSSPSTSAGDRRPVRERHAYVAAAASPAAARCRRPAHDVAVGDGGGVSRRPCRVPRRSRRRGRRESDRDHGRLELLRHVPYRPRVGVELRFSSLELAERFSKISMCSFYRTPRARHPEERPGTCARPRGPKRIARQDRPQNNIIRAMSSLDPVSPPR